MLCLGPFLPDLGHPSWGTWASGSPSDPTQGAQAGVLGVGHDLPAAPLSPMVRSRAVPGAHLTGGKTEAWACGRALSSEPWADPWHLEEGTGRRSTGVRSLGVTLLRCPQPAVYTLQPSPHPARPSSLGLTATPAGQGDIYLVPGSSPLLRTGGRPCLHVRGQEGEFQASRGWGSIWPEAPGTQGSCPPASPTQGHGQRRGQAGRLRAGTRFIQV